jgi:hypothetical protein
MLHLLEAVRHAREAMLADLLDWSHIGHAGTAYDTIPIYLNICKRLQHRKREAVGNVQLYRCDSPRHLCEAEQHRIISPM